MGRLRGGRYFDKRTQAAHKRMFTFAAGMLSLYRVAGAGGAADGLGSAINFQDCAASRFAWQTRPPASVFFLSTVR